MVLRSFKAALMSFAPLALAGCVAPSVNTFGQTDALASWNNILTGEPVYVTATAAPKSVNVAPWLGQADSDATRLYAQNQYQALWHDGYQWLPAAHQTMAVLAEARRHGLYPGDYLPASATALPSVPSLTDAQVADFEIKLTSGTLDYIHDVQEGRFNPSRRLDFVNVFLMGASSGDYVGWLNDLGPSNWIYRRMLNANGQHSGLVGEAWNRYRVTMERLRWDAPNLPTSGRYVLQNLGAAEVWAMDGLTIDLGTNVVVGRQSRQTPLDDDTITDLKFSPDWTAPYSIIEKDLVKFAREDPAFVDLMAVEIYSGGKRVDPFSIDWDTINVRQYVWKQPPGPANVLGGVRFTLNNSNSIFMHDSPDRSLFDDDFRAKSSGCVRIGASDELALWLLRGEDQSWTLGRVRERMNRGEINVVELDRPVEVKTIYTTAWVSHDGRLVTMPDTYAQNHDLRRRMGIPIEQVTDDGPETVQSVSDIF